MSRVLGVLALAALLAMPLVAADHVYSHQYRVFGRVMDADGDPVEGALVFIEIKKTQQPDRISFKTDCLGDYGFAANEHFHTHGISTVAELQVSVFDPSDPSPLAERTVTIERGPRATHLDWKLDRVGNLTTSAECRATVDRELFVMGRLWNSTKETRLEDVTVFGEIPGSCQRVGQTEIRCQEVQVEVTVDGRRMNSTAWSNNYGDYFTRFDVGAWESAKVKATWLDRTVEVDADPFFRTAVANLYSGESVVGRPAPGVGLVAALAAVGVALVLVGRR